MPTPSPEWPSTRTVVRVLVTLLAAGIILWVLWQARSVLVWVVAAAFIATVLNPLIRVLTPWVRHRFLAVTLVYLGAIGAVTVATILFLPDIVSAGVALADQIPALADDVRRWQWVQWVDENFDLTRRLSEYGQGRIDALIAGPESTFGVVGDIVRRIVGVIAIAFMSFLFALSGPRIWAHVLTLAGARRAYVARIGVDVYAVLGGWVAGAIVVTIIATTCATVVMLILGLPYIPLLALWVFLMSFIPMIGSTIGALPYITLAFIKGPGIGLAALIFFVVYQQLEANVIGPLVMRRAVRLNPLWVIIAALMGATVFGLLGALAAVPVAGIIQVLLVDWWQSRQDGTTGGGAGGGTSGRGAEGGTSL